MTRTALVAAKHILKYPDPRLRQKCAPVEAFDETLAALAASMIELMHGQRGIGLAGPQVGVPLRVFVCNLTGKPGDDLVVVNPELTDLEGAETGDEGCLSLPEVTVAVRRFLKCTLKAHDLTGRAFRRTGKGLAARCWQHECDHLAGRLIIDRMSEADKIANRKAIKELESHFRGRK